MREKQHRLRGLIQRLYITWDTFVANDLFTYAAAGAYSFFLSMFPIILMVLVVLIRIFHTSPDLIRELIVSSGLVDGDFSLDFVMRSITSIQRFGTFEVIIAVSVFWMARRLFAAIMQGITVIYKKRGKSKPIKENLVMIAGEAIVVIVSVVVVVAIISGKAFFGLALSDRLLTPIVHKVLRNVLSFAPYGLLLTFLFLVYLAAPRTRPRPLHCLFSAAACTGAFALVQAIFRSFINMSNYNLVYGILSNVIVIVLEVYLFFFLFLFFAQYLYVSQFFESFLLSRLCLLPEHDDPNPIRQLERVMFIEPPHFYRRYAVHRYAGETIFNLGDASTSLYYVWNGSIELQMPGQVIALSRGKIFGEFTVITGGKRTGTARALTDCVLLEIPGRIFEETVETDGAISRRTLQQMADYVRKTNQTPLFHETEI